MNLYEIFWILVGGVICTVYPDPFMWLNEKARKLWHELTDGDSKNG